TGVPSTFNGQQVFWTGNGGNAKIKPWKANAYDLSVERYFGRKGYVSAALFYKELTSYIYTQTLLKDYSGAALPGSCYRGAARTVKVMVGSTWVCSKADANRIGTISGQANGDGGWIKGAEFTVSLPGELLAPWLDGFGTFLTASFNDGKIDPNHSG